MSAISDKIMAMIDAYYASEDEGDRLTKRANLRIEIDGLESVSHEIDWYVAAFPTCDKHRPRGGARSGCVICNAEKLMYALSRVSYACGKPNEYGMSQYDTDYDEDAVVRAVDKKVREFSEWKQRYIELFKEPVAYMFVTRDRKRGQLNEFAAIDWSPDLSDSEHIDLISKKPLIFAPSS